LGIVGSVSYWPGCGNVQMKAIIENVIIKGDTAEVTLNLGPRQTITVACPIIKTEAEAQKQNRVGQLTEYLKLKLSYDSYLKALTIIDNLDEKRLARLLDRVFVNGVLDRDAAFEFIQEERL